MVFQIHADCCAERDREIALFQNDLPAVVPTADILRRMRVLADRFRLAVDPWMPVRELAVGDRKRWKSSSSFSPAPACSFSTSPLGTGATGE